MTASSAKFVIHGSILNVRILNTIPPVMCITYAALYAVVSATLVNYPSPAQNLLKMKNLAPLKNFTHVKSVILTVSLIVCNAINAQYGCITNALNFQIVKLNMLMSLKMNFFAAKDVKRPHFAAQLI